MDVATGMEKRGHMKLNFVDEEQFKIARIPVDKHFAVQVVDPHPGDGMHKPPLGWKASIMVFDESLNNIWSRVWHEGWTEIWIPDKNEAKIEELVKAAKKLRYAGYIERLDLTNDRWVFMRHCAKGEDKQFKLEHYAHMFGKNVQFWKQGEKDKLRSAAKKTKDKSDG